MPDDPEHYPQDIPGTSAQICALVWCEDEHGPSRWPCLPARLSAELAEANRKLEGALWGAGQREHTVRRLVSERDAANRKLAEAEALATANDERAGGWAVRAGEANRKLAEVSGYGSSEA